MNGGAGGMSPSADGAHCVRRASYDRGSMLDVTVAGSCAASCLRSVFGWLVGGTGTHLRLETCLLLLLPPDMSVSSVFVWKRWHCEARTMQ